MRAPFIVIIVTYTISIIGLLVIDGVDNNGNPYHLTIFDAFYFITYTATTIGFGESPYDFTYSQKLWVTFSIYITVIGWFYGVGSLVSLLQNKLFVCEIEKLKFKMRLNSIKTKFIIVLGFNEITSKIIQRALDDDIRVIVIEKNEDKANELKLESFTPYVPVLVADVSSSGVLEYAGIKCSNCRAVISLFEDDTLNLKVAIMAKMLNKNVTLAVKSTTQTQKENLQDINVEIVENYFEIIAKELNMAITTPNLFKLEKWLYKLDTLSSPLPNIPEGKYIIAGFGRLGRHLFRVFKDNKNIQLQFIEIDGKKLKGLSQEILSVIEHADADDKSLLEELGIKDAKAIIAFTDSDTSNLSIIATAKKLNPNIVTIAREVEIGDKTIFAHADIDYIFVPSKILINKTTNALFNPLCDIFLSQIHDKEDIWAAELTRRLVSEIDENPLTYELKIDLKQTPTIYEEIKKGVCLDLKIFATSLYNRYDKNNIIPLLICRSNEIIILPSWSECIKFDDRILFAADENALTHLEYICQNVNEFNYALNGQEKKTFLFRNKRT